MSFTMVAAARQAMRGAYGTGQPAACARSTDCMGDYTCQAIYLKEPYV